MKKGVVLDAFCENAERAIREALASITPAEAQGCYKKAGYGADFFAQLERMEHEWSERAGGATPRAGRAFAGMPGHHLNGL